MPRIIRSGALASAIIAASAALIALPAAPASAHPVAAKTSPRFGLKATAAKSGDVGAAIPVAVAVPRGTTGVRLERSTGAQWTHGPAVGRLAKKSATSYTGTSSYVLGTERLRVTGSLKGKRWASRPLTFTGSQWFEVGTYDLEDFGGTAMPLFHTTLGDTWTVHGTCSKALVGFAMSEGNSNGPNGWTVSVTSIKGFNDAATFLGDTSANAPLALDGADFVLSAAPNDTDSGWADLAADLYCSSRPGGF